jgi:hypothetical protein
MRLALQFRGGGGYFGKKLNQAWRVVNLFDEPQHRVRTMAARLRLWQQQVGDTAPLPGI